MNKIVSTIGFENGTLESMISKNETFDFTVEFSSAGFPHSESNWDTFRAYSGNKLVHNYFPGYEKDSFVLNLASQDGAILKKSVQHCLKCIKETADHATLKVYAVHAGFLFDISPEEIGKPISNINPGDFQKYRRTFFESLNTLIAYAKEMGVKLLLENNVLIKENYKNELPFFCINGDGISSVLSEFKRDIDHFGFLLDTAHLKVSCNTLGLNLTDEFKKIRPFIQGLHHSDNAGLYDTNDEFNSDYWLLDVFDEELKQMPNTLEVKKMDELKIDQLFNILNL